MAAEFSVRTHISAPPRKVWDRLTTVASWSEWNVPHGGFPEAPPASLAMGTKFREGTKLMNHPAEIAWTVQVLDPDRTLLLEGQGPAGVSLRQEFLLEPSDDGGTNVEVGTVVDGQAVALMANKVREVGEAALNESLERLASLVA